MKNFGDDLGVIVQKHPELKGKDPRSLIIKFKLGTWDKGKNNKMATFACKSTYHQQCLIKFFSEYNEDLLDLSWHQHMDLCSIPKSDDKRS